MTGIINSDNESTNRVTEAPRRAGAGEARKPRLTVTLSSNRAGELRVGESVIFIALAKNEGGAAAQDVVISCGLDSSVLEPVMSSWNCAEMAYWDGSISVGPLRSGDIAALGILAKAVRAGTVKVRAVIESAGAAPLSSTELTTVVKDVKQ